jgi:hypothetical protein
MLMHERFRDAISRGESVKVAEWSGDGRAIVRTLEAHEIADWERASWKKMEDWAKALIEAHEEIKDALPPNFIQIQLLLRLLESGKATADEIEEFRRIANETLREWQPQHPPAFKESVEAALKRLEGPL